MFLYSMYPFIEFSIITENKIRESFSKKGLIRVCKYLIEVYSLYIETINKREKNDKANTKQSIRKDLQANNPVRWYMVEEAAKSI